MAFSVADVALGHVLSSVAEQHAGGFDADGIVGVGGCLGAEVAELEGCLFDSSFFAGPNGISNCINTLWRAARSASQQGKFVC